ncbi:hypothetical protein PROFUN_11306 [Planoprotostelium fungivorum]|uniref:Uncharacterized protein n=1 Tax=Planoprotostelium fungivorum TaxID=1890364 RepID=A0A2P6N2J2_9EUKA|nr:hypothetical protein PROFUN_11306 [Planoprotostelium fungivorum]
MDFAQVGHRFCDLCDIPLESAHLRESESGQKGGYQVIDDTLPRYKNTWATQKYIQIFRPDGGCQVSFLSSMGRCTDKGPRALIFLTHITICIIFVNQDIYRWNQRSLLSQKQVERHMAYTLSKVRITLNNSLRRLNSSVIWTLLKLGIVSVTCVTYHWNQRISESQNQGGYQVIDDTLPRYKNTWATQKYIQIFRPDVSNREKEGARSVSSVPWVDVRKNYKEMYTKPPSNHYHQR